jgi:hypothetical protein
MKRVTPPLITIGLSLLLALFSAALSYSGPSDAQRMSLPSGSFFTQGTPTPTQQDKSVVGSTDQIVLMSAVISGIIVIPILMSRKSWH